MPDGLKLVVVCRVAALLDDVALDGVRVRGHPQRAGHDGQHLDAHTGADHWAVEQCRLLLRYLVIIPASTIHASSIVLKSILEIFANICERFLNVHIKLHINICNI